MKPPYFDSSLIVKLYLREPNSATAVKLIEEFPTPYLLTPLQELEVRTTIHLNLFRQHISSLEASEALNAFEQDIGDAWQLTFTNMTEVHARATTLTHANSAVLGCRSLDILHVASACVLGAEQFLTFDRRQMELARRAGLAVKP